MTHNSAIRLKRKACKGHGKAKGFTGCGEEVLKRTYGLCDRCLREWSYSTGEGQEYLRSKVIPRAKKLAQHKEKTRMKERKDRVTNWKNKLQEELQKIARLIDVGLPCLATQKPMKQAHGGHVFPKGSHPEMRFNLHNLHRQSAYSNTYRNDDGLMQEGLIRGYGKEYLEFVKSLKETPVPKYSNKEYQDFTKKAREIVRSLQEYIKVRTALVLTVNQRVTLRNIYNKELGIYSQKYCEFNQTE